MSTVRVSRRFTAKPEEVFDAWLNAGQVGKWLFATPTGQMVRIDIDARTGGSFVITERRDGVDVEHTGTYFEIDRPHRLVFTFIVPKYSSDVSRVTIEIVSLGPDCELKLTHINVLPDYAKSL